VSRLIVGPFNRVEGDLEVRLTISGGVVEDAEVVSPLYRGFERMLTGKPAADALVYAPRICGICSVSQSVAAARALAAAAGVALPPNGRLAINIIHAVENLADHLTHFYLFFMPDFARAVYAGEDWHGQAAARFAAITGAAAREFLPARAQLMQMMGVLAGKWPHTLSIQPGGSTRAITAAEKARLRAQLAAFRHFLEKTLFGGPLETLLALGSAEQLAAWAGAAPPQTSDFRHFLHIADRLALDRLGSTPGAYLSYGAYEQEGGFLFERGTLVDGAARPLDLSAIAEDVSHAWYAGSDHAEAPAAGRTEPSLDNPQGYTWCKAPRLAGRPMEVGALARQLVAAQPLIRDLAGRGGGNVQTRIIARLIEAAHILIAMETWLKELDPRQPFIVPQAVPADGEGAGLTEAARGSLGHWVRVQGGTIRHYQIIAPTTWNFSPRDAQGTSGPLEQALRGTPVRSGETEPVAVQHVVRSFDPCMVCTVH
jgi:uptake hydrogenase large subunit